ncbi:hypothetical protein BDN72DRAFT_765868 [Pluteus cervinus]|uniref:Uncharacterized protein n=1 Tax=Pluteus cervinus TaxID=181527 RepID=A0ACD3AYR5_9AGAR|nr:hypothetical protein BDN72DRAFT_765868 [Pluteus cervinus]
MSPENSRSSSKQGNPFNSSRLPRLSDFLHSSDRELNSKPQSSEAQKPKPRKPKPLSKNFISHNSLRPQVLARDRLRLWSTPYSIEHHETVFSSLPENLAAKTLDTIFTAHAPSTQSSYGAGILRFSQFCDRHGISEANRMPASYILLTAFIADHKGTVSGNTIKSWMSSLKAWHDLNHAPWNGDDRWVQLAKTAAFKAGTSFSKPPRPPVSLSHLYLILQSLNLSIPQDAAYWAITLTAFWGCRRLGELTTSTQNSFDPKFHVSKSTQITFKTLSDGTHSASFHIPWTKSKKQQGGTIVLTARKDELCPVKALCNHLKINHSTPSGSHLFSFCTKSHPFYSLPDKPRFLLHCKSTIQSLAADIIFGHSFRIGGSVELLLAGVPPEVVASLGEWTSLAFLLYWRRIEDIIPRSISSAYHKKSLTEISQSLDAFQILNNIPHNVTLH